jgi:hypothetical protein
MSNHLEVCCIEYNEDSDMIAIKIYEPSLRLSNKILSSDNLS